MNIVTFLTTSLRSVTPGYRDWRTVGSMGSGSVLPVGALMCFLAVWPAGDVLSDSKSSSHLKLIELYTSHGCSSCPPADDLLGELLAEDENLLALEFHVDYWDNLVHGKDGNFVDPFSKASHSMRQRQYNATSLKGRPGVYTPQAIVNGRYAAVGSNRRHIAKALSLPVEQAFQVTIMAGSTPNALTVEVTGSSGKRAELAGTDITVAHYIDKAVTFISGGENRNMNLTNHRIVTSLTRLGEVSAAADMRFSVQKPANDGGCVILVQEDALTPVYAAFACP